MGFFAACAVIVCLVSASRAAPLPCEDLVRPLDQVDSRQMEGRWVLIAGSLSHLPYLERFKQRDSASINVSSITSETSMSYTRSIRMDNKCSQISVNISLEGTSFTYDGIDKSNLTANFVHTSCHDCMLMHINVDSGKRQHFYLFSRRRQLEQKEMDDFIAQVECLNMPPPVFKDATKELCPVETASDQAAPTEEKTEGQNS